MNFGSPTKVNNLIKAFTIVRALIFLTGITSEKRVDEHMIVNKYSLPILVFDNGPTQSIITLLKGSSVVGRCQTKKCQPHLNEPF